MLGINCTKCGEPWELDSFHDIPGLDYPTATQRFAVIGCAVFGVECYDDPSESDLSRASASSVLMDILGDDLDGVASMLDDLEYLGIF